MTETECYDADEQAVRALLAKHGYDPDAPRRGVAGGPGPVFSTKLVDGHAVPIWLRNRVCDLEGVLIDGHEGSDLDPGSTSCIHCDYEGPNPGRPHGQAIREYLDRHSADSPAT